MVTWSSSMYFWDILLELALLKNQKLGFLIFAIIIAKLEYGFISVINRPVPTELTLSVMNEKVMEVIYTDITLKEKTFTCGVLYHLPFLNTKSHCSFVKSFQQSLNKIDKKDRFLFCDFNFTFLHPDEQHTSKFMDTIYKFGFILLISQPTKIFYCSATSLHHIWTNSSIRYKLNAAIAKSFLSDHLSVKYACLVKILKNVCRNLIVFLVKPD